MNSIRDQKEWEWRWMVNNVSYQLRQWVLSGMGGDVCVSVQYKPYLRKDILHWQDFMFKLGRFASLLGPADEENCFLITTNAGGVYRLSKYSDIVMMDIGPWRPPTNRGQVLHRDGNPYNNELSNLEIIP